MQMSVKMEKQHALVIPFVEIQLARMNVIAKMVLRKAGLVV